MRHSALPPAARLATPARERDERRDPAPHRRARPCWRSVPAAPRPRGRWRAARSDSSCWARSSAPSRDGSAITLLDQVRRRVGVRRDYESLYALGVAFTAFAAAEAVGGSGFLAAFAAGSGDRGARRGALRLLPRLRRGVGRDVPAADLRGVRRGAHLDRRWPRPTRARWSSPRVALLRADRGADPGAPIAPGWIVAACRIIAWLGPRGLSSLLLVLLPVFAGRPGVRPALRDHLPGGAAVGGGAWGRDCVVPGTARR